jgi:hypothetical protein
MLRNASDGISLDNARPRRLSNGKVRHIGDPGHLLMDNAPILMGEAVLVHDRSCFNITEPHFHFHKAQTRVMCLSIS